MPSEGERAFLEQLERKRRELPDASFAFQTRRVGRVMSRYFNEHLRPKVGLFATQIDVLAAVKAIPNASLRVLARRLGTAESTVSRSLKRLESKGLIRRRIPKAGDDQRLRLPMLTESGEESLRRGQETIEKFPQRRIASRFGKEISNALRRSSEKLTLLTEFQRSQERYVERFVGTHARWQYYWVWEGMTEEEAFQKWRAEGYRPRPHRPPTPKPDD